MKGLQEAGASRVYSPPSSFKIDGPFVSDEIAERDDLIERQARLAGIVAKSIIPSLLAIHRDGLDVSQDRIAPPSEGEIEKLAGLVLGPDIHAAANYIVSVKNRGLPLEILFVELLEPAARCLGQMWEDDRCDFIDVTLGVARLQQLLAIFNDTHELPALGDMRRVLMMTVAGEQHLFGIAIVERFLSAAGWQVQCEHGLDEDAIAQAVAKDWFAVAGLTLSCETRLDALAAVIATVRRYSRNPTIGIMVGGPAFAAHPEYIAEVGADAAAAGAPAAVLLAQKLFDLGIAGRKSKPSTA